MSDVLGTPDDPVPPTPATDRLGAPAAAPRLMRGGRAVIVPVRTHGAHGPNATHAPHAGTHAGTHAEYAGDLDEARPASAGWRSRWPQPAWRRAAGALAAAVVVGGAGVYVGRQSMAASAGEYRDAPPVERPASSTSLGEIGDRAESVPLTASPAPSVAVPAAGSTSTAPVTPPQPVAAAPSAPVSGPASTPTPSPARVAERPSPTPPAAARQRDRATTVSHARPKSRSGARPPASAAPRAGDGESAAASSASTPLSVAELDAAARASVERTVAAYASAIESRDVAQIARVYTAMSPSERTSWQQFFHDVSSVDARLEVDDVRRISNVVAEGRVTGFFKYGRGPWRRGGRRPVEFRGLFARDATGSWRIVEIR